MNVQLCSNHVLWEFQNPKLVLPMETILNGDSYKHGR